MNASRIAFTSLALLAVLVSSRAAAIDVPVVYTVDAKALKPAVSGTDHTYELHSDSACTSLLDSAIQPIDDAIVVSLKRAKITDAAKPPKTAEIRMTLAGVDVAGHLFLKVTGTGITPVGGACQAQAATGDLPETCNDGVLNQDESDVDCGGSACDACANGLDCNLNDDCVSTQCTGSICVTPTCSDGILNQNESDVDCGGICGSSCLPGQMCSLPADCVFGICVGTCL